ncbi:hypothetical protein QBC44DRAFT_307043 [Cladorrhinum sp. PSN332]|nr:hypothetical protein QBC44DRAFT_307043 [Cladorrhinum sp. PSN332]
MLDIKLAALVAMASCLSLAASGATTLHCAPVRGQCLAFQATSLFTKLGNLSLLLFCVAFGPVKGRSVSSHIMWDMKTGRSRGYGWALKPLGEAGPISRTILPRPLSVERAMQTMNGRRAHQSVVRASAL